MTMTYADIVSALFRAGIPRRELHGAGHVAVVPFAARVVAMAFTSDGPNIFWSHPRLTESELVKDHPERLVGNIGGDRLWCSPEVRYFWDGAPDWQNLSNYDVPPELDPGNYCFDDDVEGDAISLRSRVELRVRDTGDSVGFEVQRTVRMTPPPTLLDSRDLELVQYVGIQSSHTLQFDSATRCGHIDLWHLLQVPVGSLLILPLRPCTTIGDRAPLFYTGLGKWIEHSDCLLWRYGGTAHTKVGVSSRALTGSSGILRPFTPGHLCLIVRQFSVDPLATYGDHPYGIPRNDQAFQIWDGLGFGEMEYHSPMLDAQHGPRLLEEVEYLYAFAGPPRSIHALAQKLLDVQLDMLAALTDLSEKLCSGAYHDD